MIRRATRPAALALLSCIAVVAAARPACAFFAVEQRGSTVTVNQNDTASLTVVRNPGGELVVSDGVGIAAYPAAKHLVVRGSSALTASFVNLVLNEPLPGSLTLELPGASDVTISGPGAVIGGSFKVKGSDEASQTVRLGDAAQSITIDGNAKLDLRDAEDWVEFRGPAKILGSLHAKGVNHLWAKMLEVGGSFSIDVKRESRGIDFRPAQQLFVGRSFTVTSGPGHDYVGASNGGAVGGNATFKMGDGGCTVYAYVVIGGNATARLGAGVTNEFYPLHVKGSVDVQTFADRNYLELRGRIEGRSIKYTGGAGYDDLLLQTNARDASAVIALGAGNDRVYLDGRSLQLARLRLDLGDGTDMLDSRDFVPPPGSTITGQP
jgi:hypothetical protein